MFKRWLEFFKSLARPYDGYERPAERAPTGAIYRAYTTEFDVIVSGADLTLRFPEIVDVDHSTLDPTVAIDPNAFEQTRQALLRNCEVLNARLKTSLSSEVRDDTVVSLLLDHSGSLRGGRILPVAETAEVLADALTDAGIATDILGFTTPRWKGGRSRAKWLKAYRPPFPGRLNDLLHIVHLDASEGPRRGPHQFPVMRSPSLLKENIDGEALEWAHARLVAHPRKRKALIIVSDGAPVDDATLLANWSTILVDHLREVVARIEADGTVALGGIGIDYEVGRFYRNTAVAKPALELAQVAPDFVEHMIRLAQAPTT